MGMTQCPECNAKISESAYACPRCGFAGDNPKLPISLQSSHEAPPIFMCQSDEDLISLEGLFAQAVVFDNRQQLIKTLGDWNWVKTYLPDIATSIYRMASANGQLVADISPYMKQMIADGRYFFNIDSGGRLLPTIRDASGKIVRQVRLKETVGGQAELANLFSNISTHMFMAQLMDFLEFIRSDVQDIHFELQDDRLAKAESAKELFLAAQRMTDPVLRERALLNAVQIAAEAKYALMRNFEHNMRFVSRSSQKSLWQMAIDSTKQQSVPIKATDAFNDLASATLACQVECFSYIALGEKESASICISNFSDFLIDNHLHESETLTLLHENIRTKDTKTLENYKSLVSAMISFQEDLLPEHDSTLTIESGE